MQINGEIKLKKCWEKQIAILFLFNLLIFRILVALKRSHFCILLTYNLLIIKLIKI